MNKTTVKRGIGAVILALIAAALLALLLNDKAAQRQEVVEIALPGTGDSVETSGESTRLPTLTTDNSGNGDVIANAGSGNGATSQGNGTSTTTSGKNPDGTIIASAAATGAAAVGAASSAVADSTKSIDFSVKPTASKASGDFLDLVNNGDSPAADKPKASADTESASAAVQETAPSSTSNPDQGVVIASTSPKSVDAKANVVQPRLIGEKRSAPVKSSRTATVITKKAPAKQASAASSNSTSATSTNASNQAKNGYAIQLLATSSQSRANNLKNVMAGEGYPTYVTKTQQNGKTLYRVRIGQYAVKSAAVKAQTAMKRRYKKNTNVNRSAVVAR